MKYKSETGGFQSHAAGGGGWGWKGCQKRLDSLIFELSISLQ